MNNRSSILAILLLLSGCASPQIQGPSTSVAYPVMPSPAHISGTATIEAAYEPGTALLAAWKDMDLDEAAITRYREEVEKTLINDFSTGRLFSNVIPAGGTKPDYIVKIRAAGVPGGTGYLMVRVTVEVFNGATGNKRWTLSQESGIGPVRGPQRPLSAVLPQMMFQLKMELASAVAQKMREDAEIAEIAGLKTAPLGDLLVSSDRNSVIARERNRAIVAAKNRQLPEILRNWKTDQISALVVKIEQTILDLDHECELAKDKAQQSVADGTTQAPGSGAIAEGRMARMRGLGMAAPAQGFLGISMTDVDGGQGVLVQEVLAGGPAERAGVRPSDVIVAADSQMTPTAEALKSFVSQTAPGTSVVLKVRRNGAEMTQTVVIGQKRETAPNSLESLRDISISYRERIELLKPILGALKEEVANRNR